MFTIQGPDERKVSYATLDEAKATAQHILDTMGVVVSIEQEWNTEQLRADFEVIAFLAPFVEVRRRSDGAKGSLLFERRGEDRVYFAWVEES